jgi:chromosome segregation ATPase
MSKAEKSANASATSQLGKDLVVFERSLQQLTISVAKHEKSLTDAGIALGRERSLREKVDTLHQEVKDLEEAHRKEKYEREVDIASFTDVNQKIVKEYEARSAHMKDEYDSRLKECQKREDALEQMWKQKIEMEQVETHRLRETVSRDRQNSQNELHQAKESHREEVEQLQSSLQQNQQLIDNLLNDKKSLKHELAEYEAMLKGRDIQMHRIASRLATLEAFPAQSEDT